jgi:hypothetical protein
MHCSHCPSKNTSVETGIECLHDRARGLCICHDVKAHALAALHAPVHHAARYKLLMLLLPLITVSLHPDVAL